MGKINWLRLVLAASIPASSLQGAPTRAPAAFGLEMPSALARISATHVPQGASAHARPDVILIQDLHVNRTVQSGISSVLAKLSEQQMLPSAIGVEGYTGPIDLSAVQRLGTATQRLQAADYLISQGEIPGAVHYAVTRGSEHLVGVENAAAYDAILQAYRTAYEGRDQWTLMRDALKISVRELNKDASLRDQSAVLAEDLRRVDQLMNFDVARADIQPALTQASLAIDHLQPFWPSPTAEYKGSAAIAAAANFYALALLRDEYLFQNLMALRKSENQTTSVLVVGGFHTDALTQYCREKGLSYAVITPRIRRASRIDDRLYVERMLDRHLTDAQIAEGRDWASMLMAPPSFSPRAALGAFNAFISGRLSGISFSPKRWLVGALSSLTLVSVFTTTPVAETVTSKPDAYKAELVSPPTGDLAEPTSIAQAQQWLNLPPTQLNHVDQALRAVAYLTQTAHVALRQAQRTSDAAQKVTLLARADEASSALVLSFSYAARAKNDRYSKWRLTQFRERYTLEVPIAAADQWADLLSAYPGYRHSGMDSALAKAAVHDPTRRDVVRETPIRKTGDRLAVKQGDRQITTYTSYTAAAENAALRALTQRSNVFGSYDTDRDKALLSAYVSLYASQAPSPLLLIAHEFFKRGFGGTAEERRAMVEAINDAVNDMTDDQKARVKEGLKRVIEPGIFSTLGFNFELGSVVLAVVFGLPILVAHIATSGWLLLGMGLGFGIVGWLKLASVKRAVANFRQATTAETARQIVAQIRARGVSLKNAVRDNLPFRTGDAVLDGQVERVRKNVIGLKA